ncbi:SMI1/KNR4 family protein [Leucobacter sp. HNU]|uniref:SMI1/KNR4 family protein n=1 Tax=Leucobacter sp. HNU TaxID=3236805 RepID=UPI003A811A6E
MTSFSAAELSDLFDDSEYGREKYTEPAPSDELVAEVEAELGYRLPAAYVELCRTRNGGTLRRNCFPTEGVHVWAEDHVAVTGLRAIGRTATWSLLGDLGSPFMQSEWGYPDIGVCFADTPTAGHSEFMLDYRACGPKGEPAVVLVDQEADYRISFVAPDFATFIRGLVPEEVLENDPEEAFAEEFETVEEGSFSPIVLRGLAALGPVLDDGEASIREIGRRIVREKEFFALHADADSHLMYATMFLLYSALTTARSREDFIDKDPSNPGYDHPCYAMMIPSSCTGQPYGFTTGGWARGFVEDWWDTQIASGGIVAVEGGFRFSPDTEAGLVRVLNALARA